jgi:hypothetical protein
MPQILRKGRDDPSMVFIKADLQCSDVRPLARKTLSLRNRDDARLIEQLRDGDLGARGTVLLADARQRFIKRRTSLRQLCVCGQRDVSP